MFVSCFADAGAAGSICGKMVSRSALTPVIPCSRVEYFWYHMAHCAVLVLLYRKSLKYRDFY